MDPKECLLRLSTAIDNSDYSDAVAALNDYYTWRLHGGFQPTGVVQGARRLDGDAWADRCANSLADALEGKQGC